MKSHLWLANGVTERGEAVFAGDTACVKYQVGDRPKSLTSRMTHALQYNLCNAQPQDLALVSLSYADKSARNESTWKLGILDPEAS